MAHVVPPPSESRSLHPWVAGAIQIGNVMPKKKHPGGRPPKYKKEYCRMAKEIIRHTGFSIAKLAKVFDVKPQSVYNWMGEHQEFFESIRDGRKIFEGIKIERSLVRRATGYRFTETTREKTDDGNMEIVRKVTKHVAPDVAAIKHWQINMLQAYWSDKQKHEISTPPDSKIQIEFVKSENSDTR